MIFWVANITINTKASEFIILYLGFDVMKNWNPFRASFCCQTHHIFSINENNFSYFFAHCRANSFFKAVKAELTKTLMLGYSAKKGSAFPQNHANFPISYKSNKTTRISFIEYWLICDKNFFLDQESHIRKKVYRKFLYSCHSS